MKYNIGDKVRIINYGHMIHIGTGVPGREPGPCDIRPELIGLEGVVEKGILTQGVPGYSIDGIGAWYHEDQLELVMKNNVYA